MSTLDDKILPRQPPTVLCLDMPTPKSAMPSRNAAQTRQRILDAARRCFSSKSYENVGIREIAGASGVDAALVSRYFGGKEQLFAHVIEGAFNVEDHLPENLEDIGAFLVGQVLNDEPQADDDGFNPLRLLILAAASPETASVVSERFKLEFVHPLALRLGGKNADARAALIAAYVIGIATMRHLLDSPDLKLSAQDESMSLLVDAIQSCVIQPG
ncbi:TetR/AcrR family transcriptional regulator [Pseudomonas sp. B6002]|uniref:TetR/AcrR family transcriptional regulator n=1 Tax=Pseudomonas sp. B6002 TaxID=2726978 RepID=UPI0015A4EC0C|nr:TetR/AcrR family transcriptional regulator [Pseudomonas sp. B6002]NVZ54462.1 TetR/AcrR family transcriptional regulator [Pseudomonas sp. B6002]